MFLMSEVFLYARPLESLDSKRVHIRVKEFLDKITLCRGTSLKKPPPPLGLP
jgi:hypothetical protein